MNEGIFWLGIVLMAVGGLISIIYLISVNDSNSQETYETVKGLINNIDTSGFKEVGEVCMDIKGDIVNCEPHQKGDK